MYKLGESNWTEGLTETELDENRRAPFGPKAGIAFGQIGAILSLLPPPPCRVLDAGCGDGHLSEILYRQGYQPHGADVCISEIEYANRRRPGTFYLSDFDHLPIPSGGMDAIVFCETLHHSVDRTVTLKEAYRVLKPGGMLIASEPGFGHGMHRISREWSRRMNVTERSCPPIATAWTGYRVGFRGIRIYPSAYSMGSVFNNRPQLRENAVARAIRAMPAKLAFLGSVKWLHGIITMEKYDATTRIPRSHNADVSDRRDNPKR